MAKGTISVQTENIFPIIKKFLYSDHEIFLRELIANATDATKKLQALSSMGDFKGELGDLSIDVKVDKEAKTITITDRGLGMTSEEVEKYINQIAFSGAEEFVEKFKDQKESQSIIGKFGLGFYSAFMVAERVEVITKSFKDEAAAHWECDGSPTYTLKKAEKADRGTEIILHVAEDSTEFLEDARIQSLLTKYNKFMPIPIRFGTKSEWIDNKEGKKDDDGNVVKEEIKVDNIINNPTPAWTKTPSSLESEDYKQFYKELYPMNFQESLFHIHLNVDYPFNLTGILYFPKISPKMEVQRDKIQLYSRQVFITDSVEGIVPDFLTLLHGVIDSPDIPLNVSRSYLQADGNVKKIASHISKKVSDKLEQMFKTDREDFEKKWDDIKFFIEYGMLTDEKFFERVQKFALYKTTEGKYYTKEELIEKIKPVQTDKDDKLVVLYSNDVDNQYAFIQPAIDKGYAVLVMDTPLTAHIVGKLEQSEEKTSFVRIDSDTIDNIINKEEEVPNKLSEDEQKKVEEMIKSVVGDSYQVKVEAQNQNGMPMSLLQPEFMRRMKEMNELNGMGMGAAGFPDMYNLTINANHNFTSKILQEQDDAKQKEMIQYGIDLAKLSHNLLKGEALAKFTTKSVEYMCK